MIYELQEDILYCQDVLGCDAEETNDLITAAERVGTPSVEYFADEFIFIVEGCDDIIKYHTDEYLNLNAFNELHGIYFEEVE